MIGHDEIAIFECNYGAKTAQRMVVHSIGKFRIVHRIVTSDEDY